MINRITRQNYSDIFKDIIDAENEVDSNEQWDGREQNLYCTKVYEITLEKFPEYPQLWGYWQTMDEFILDPEDYSFDQDVITELIRVVKKVRTIKEEYWSAA